MRRDSDYGKSSGKKERLNGAQPMGKRMGYCYGRDLAMGIPSYDGEPEKANLVPLKNRFSAQHDVSMSEAMKMVKGHTTSSRINKMNDTD